MKVVRIFQIIVLITPLLWRGDGGEAFAQQDSIALKFSQTITANDLSKHLHILASDEYEGRETGRKGQKMAAEYIATHFKNLNFPPIVNDTSYFQHYPLKEESVGDVSISINDIPYKFLKDFYCTSRSSANMNLFANEIIFLGYGIETDKYNDYKDMDVDGKVILIFQNEPMKKKISQITGTENTSEWTYQWRKKLETAKKKGVAAILFVVEDIEKTVKKEMHGIQYTSMKLENDTSVNKYLSNFYISKEMAQQIIVSKQKDILDIKRFMNETGTPYSFVTKNLINIKVQKQNKNNTAENVLGYLEGSELKDEVILLTAHYDHIGIDGKGDVYNGADDDGSGTVAVMEIAKAFAEAAKNGCRPKRSILFMTVSGEEKGLLGSDYYSQHPVFPLENTVADLNIDMIGRLDKKHKKNPDYVYVIGSNMLSSELHQINEAMNNTYTKLELDYTYNDPDEPNRFYYRSDHYNFAKNNIPIIFYFNGVHKDYHQPTDEVKKINFEKMEKISRLVFFTAWELANRKKRIEVDMPKGTH